MIGGLYENSVSRKILSSSIPYFQDDLTWCVASAGLASTLFNVINVFNKLIWTATIIIIFMSGVITYLNSRFEKDKRDMLHSFFVSFAIMFNTTIGYLPKRVEIRLFMAVLLIYSLHFSAFYNSFLLGILTKPRFDHQISSIRMALSAGMKFHGNEDVLQHFKSKQNDTVRKFMFN